MARSDKMPGAMCVGRRTAGLGGGIGGRCKAGRLLSWAPSPVSRNLFFSSLRRQHGLRRGGQRVAEDTLRRVRRRGRVALGAVPDTIMVLTAGWEAGMDRASALLAALRARAVLGGTAFEGRCGRGARGGAGARTGRGAGNRRSVAAGRPCRAGLGRRPSCTAGATDGGGRRNVGAPTFTLQGVTFGPGATIAGRDATGATVCSTTDEVFGALAAVLGQLRMLRPELDGEAAKAADEAALVLSYALKPRTTPMRSAKAGV